MKGIDVGNRVVVTGGLEGIVVTIFYWFTEERRANKPVMVGVLLDKRKGNSDGVYQGVRHFFCENGRGIFVENFDVRLQTTRATIGFGETRGLSRANSVYPVLTAFLTQSLDPIDQFKRVRMEKPDSVFCI